MINTKLIIFEGIPGSGKTTTSQLLHKCFQENGIDSQIFIEGCEHPIDLTFYSYLSYSQYHALILQYKEQTEWLKKHSILEDNYVLTPYKIPDPYPRNDTLIEYLRSKEFCYSNKPVVSFGTFKQVFYRRFEQYVSKVLTKDVITIFESILFQHQIHDIYRLYPHIQNNEIIEYIRTLGDILIPLNPMLFYISQDDVRESMRRTAVIRSKLMGPSEEKVAYYEKRKALELAAMKSLPFHSVILDNTEYNWDKMFGTIVHKLSLSIRV